MIEKIDALRDTFITMVRKHNALVDAVNELQEFCDVADKNLATLMEENNIHEKQIDELQMKVEPEKCEIPVDPYAEQRKWIGKACWFWDGCVKTRAFGKLNQVDTEYNDAPFQTNFGQWYEHCEPVKPDDDIIFKGGDNE